MDAFEWKESYNVGHKELDSDHRKFFELLHDCYLDSCSYGSERIDPDIIRRIKTYAAMHFSYEEEVMRTCGYPDFEHHEKLHREFEKKISELEINNNIEQIDGDQKIESMSSFLRNWFLKHILEEDMKYASYVKNHDT